MSTNRSRSFTDISLNFTPHPITGDLVLLKDEDAIKKAVINIVQTIPGERPYNENLGSNVQHSLFENFDYGTAGVIQSQIEQAISLNEKRVRLDSVVVFPNIDQNRYDVNINFTIVGSEIIFNIATAFETNRS